jgi:hypothetical protein
MSSSDVRIAAVIVRSLVKGPCDGGRVISAPRKVQPQATRSARSAPPRPNQVVAAPGQHAADVERRLRPLITAHAAVTFLDPSANASLTGIVGAIQRLALWPAPGAACGLQAQNTGHNSWRCRDVAVQGYAKVPSAMPKGVRRESVQPTDTRTERSGVGSARFHGHVYARPRHDWHECREGASGPGFSQSGRPESPTITIVRTRSELRRPERIAESILASENRSIFRRNQYETCRYLLFARFSRCARVCRFQIRLIRNDKRRVSCPDTVA